MINSNDTWALLPVFFICRSHRAKRRRTTVSMLQMGKAR